MNRFTRLVPLAMALLIAGSAARAQPPSAPQPAPDTAAAKSAPEPTPVKSTSGTQRQLCDADAAGATQTFYLKNAVQQSDANEIVTAIRNMVNPCVKAFLVANQEAIVVRASASDLSTIAQLLADLDRPKKTYRLTYTVSEVDGTKLVSTQHYSMVVVSGQLAQLKQGSKVPIATGSYDSGASGAKPGASGIQTQFTYVDVGMEFTVTLDDFANGIRLNTSVEQSGVAEETAIAGVQEPIIRQTSLKSSAFLKPGQQLALGSVDIPGTGHHLDIEVTMTKLL